MSAGVWFWILYVICFLFGGYFSWLGGGGDPNRRFYFFGVNIVIFVLIGLLGWGIFGPPIK